MSAAILLQHPFEWPTLEWKENFRTLAPNGLDQVQFQMLFRKMGLAPATLRDQTLVQAMYKVFDKNGDNSISWREFQRVMNIFASDNIDAQLELTFTAFDIDNNGEITAPRMSALLPTICKGIERATGSELPFPFDSHDGIMTWISTAYEELQRMNEPMNLMEFYVVGKSSAWALSLFTLGCHIPNDTSQLSFPLSPPKSSTLKRKRNKSASSSLQTPTSSSAPTTPKRTSKMEKTNEETIVVPTELLQELESMRKKLKALEKRETDLFTKLEEAMEASDEEEEAAHSDDEWTDEDENLIVVQTEETLEEQNERLIQQVRTLQDGLKKFLDENRALRQERDELVDKNESLKQIARKLKEKVQDSDDSEASQLIANTESEEAAINRQLDSYHALLSWTLQKDRIVCPEGSNVPIPPGNTQRVEVLMKRGDFIQNWKKRLVIATDDSIFYYSDPMKVRGQIEIKMIRGVRESLDSASLPNTLEVITPDRIWALSFATKPKQLAWKEFLERIALTNTKRIAKLKQQQDLVQSKIKERGKQNKSPKLDTDIWAQ